MSASDSLGGLRGEVRVLRNPDDLANAACDLVEGIAADGRGDRFSIALAGGSTPSLLYRRLATDPVRGRIDWDRWRVYFGDERAVPPAHEGSNYRLAREGLLDHVPVAAAHVYRMLGEAQDVDAAAAEYSSLLTATLGTRGRLDCVLLGLGEDGHTASLFPDTPALDIVHARATRGRADFEPRDRITITFPVINDARAVIFTVAGAAKASALRGVLAGGVPAARVSPANGRMVWLLDRAAADAMG